METFNLESVVLILLLGFDARMMRATARNNTSSQQIQICDMG
jgi:hypothetical protein